MANPMQAETAERLTLWADTAADLMTANPISIRAAGTVRDAIALQTDRGISAAPVIDEAGRPVGVLSQSDILVHDRERGQAAVPEYYDGTELGRMTTVMGSPAGEHADTTRVSDLMTPVVFSVPPERPAAKV